MSEPRVTRGPRLPTPPVTASPLEEGPRGQPQGRRPSANEEHSHHQHPDAGKKPAPPPLPADDSLEAVLARFPNQMESALVRNTTHQALAAAENPTRAQLAQLLPSLQNLSSAEFREVFAALANDPAALEALMASLLNDPGPRAEFLHIASSKGLVEETPVREAIPSGLLVAPPQPALVHNTASLPLPLRRVIHAENVHRASAYSREFDRYADAWCQAVRDARSPHELRALGAFSRPPALNEPGWSENDRRDFGWSSGLTLSAPHQTRLLATLGDKLSDLRGEARAGSYSLVFEGSAKAQSAIESAGVTVSAKIGSQGPKFEVKGKGTMPIAEPPLPGEQTEAGLKLTRDTKDNVGGEASANVGDVGLGVAVERRPDHSVKTTFTARLTPGLGAYTVVESRGSFGAGLEAKGSLGLPKGSPVEFSARLGFTASGPPREYYQDIGGSQPGFFGPMPELDAGLPWAALPDERRAWYWRQGFTESSWQTR